MKCATCGMEVSGGSKFCENCGAPMTAVEGASDSAAAIGVTAATGVAAAAAEAAEGATAGAAPARVVDVAVDPQAYAQQAYAQPSYGRAQQAPQARQIPHAQAGGQDYWRGNAQQAHAQPGNAQQQYQQPGYQQPAQWQWAEQPATSRALAMALYIGGIIVLIIGLAVRDKNDAFITHHLNQALVLFIGAIIAGILSIIIIGYLLGIYLFVMMIMGMVQAYSSSMEELPLIGKIHILS